MKIINLQLTQLLYVLGRQPYFKAEREREGERERYMGAMPENGLRISNIKIIYGTCHRASRENGYHSCFLFMRLCVQA
jgi:hypothetical protein